MTANKSTDFSESNPAFGFFSVQVSSCGKAIPVKNALVLISKTGSQRKELFGILTTDAGGNTPSVRLPSPPASESLNPNIPNPYTVYDVQISKTGYFTEENHPAQIFGGSSSTMQVSMIPLPEYPDKEVLLY